jgi:hypothetical protein
MRHDDIQEELKAYLDNELTEPRTAEVERHLMGCADCRVLLDELTEMSWQVGQLDEHEAPEYLTTRILEAVQAPRPRTMPRLWRLGLAGAAACSVLIVSVIVINANRIQIAKNDSKSMATSLDSGKNAPPARTERVVQHRPVYVHEATVELKWSNANAGVRALRQLVADFGGTAVTEIRPVKNGPQQIVFRVPRQKQEAALARLRSIGQVAKSAPTRKDVSSDLALLKSGIDDLALREQEYLRGIGKAKDQQTVLELDRKVARAREDSARLKQRVGELEHLSTMCTIMVTIQQ